MYTCQECGKRLRTRQGLSGHHQLKHDSGSTQRLEHAAATVEPQAERSQRGSSASGTSRSPTPQFVTMDQLEQALEQLSAEKLAEMVAEAVKEKLAEMVAEAVNEQLKPLEKRVRELELTAVGEGLLRRSQERNDAQRAELEERVSKLEGLLREALELLQQSERKQLGLKAFIRATFLALEERLPNKLQEEGVIGSFAAQDLVADWKPAKLCGHFAPPGRDYCESLACISKSVHLN